MSQDGLEDGGRFTRFDGEKNKIDGTRKFLLV